MSSSDRNVAILGTFAHPAGNPDEGHPSHEGFAETIDADIISLTKPPLFDNRFVNATLLDEVSKCMRTSIPEYDIYLTGHTCTLYSAPIVKSQYPDSTFIYQATDTFLYGENLYRFDQTTMPNTLKKIERRLHTYLMRKAVRRYVDGVLAVSEFVADYVRPFVKTEVPSFIAHPYIDRDKYELLDGAEPALSTNDAVFISAWSPGFKGIDILVDAWSFVRSEFPDAVLNIVGNVPPHRYPDVDGVEFTGFVPLDEFRRILESSSLYVHPARADAFAVSVVEAMHAGLPTVVTNTTGARSEVREIDQSLVVNPNPTSIASRIIEYFSSDIRQRRELSERARQRGGRFRAASMKDEYQRTLDALLQEIEAAG